MTADKHALLQAAKLFWTPKDIENAKDRIGRGAWEASAAQHLHHLFGDDPISSEYWRKEKRDILEIGCGMGRILHQIAPLFRNVYGLDIIPEMLTMGERYLSGLGVELRLIEDNKFPVDDECIDIVFSTITFQHIPVRDVITAYLKESLRVLRPGGLIRVQTHVGEPLSGEFAGCHGWYYPSVGAFAAEFEEAGFKVLTKQSGLNHPNWLWVTASKG